MSFGRLTQTLPREAWEIAQAPGVRHALDEGGLRRAMMIDRAHLVMLIEEGLVERDTGIELLAAIDDLEREGLDTLRDEPAPRGWYLMYENHLAERTSQQAASWLPTARSRNDLGATLAMLELRDHFARVVTELIRLQFALIERSRQFTDIVMPAYTHGQPAVPITYSHYLSGIAISVEQRLLHLLHCLDDLDRCPLGAGAIGGTTVPINAARTCELLGFRFPVRHSIPAVATRDTTMLIVAHTTIAATLLSRVATDLHDWCSSDPPLLDLPDSLVGISSMMPQKRNAYLLEHVQGRAATPLGAFTTLAAGAQKVSFTNAIAVHTESTRFAADAMAASGESAALLRIVVRGAEPRVETMEDVAERGMTNATEIANQLAVEDDRGFRLAHRMVGDAARRALRDGQPLHDALDAEIDLSKIAVDRIARRAHFGGGAAKEEAATRLDELTSTLLHVVDDFRRARHRWNLTPGRVKDAAQNIRRG